MAKAELIRHGVNPRSKVRYGADWILADCSESMLSPVVGTTKSRIDLVNLAAASYPPETQRLAFNSAVTHLQPGEEFMAWGGTMICPALRFLADWRPVWVGVISDGEIADSAEEALEIAREIARQATIETIYIGPDVASEAMEFMKRLADIGSGRYQQHDTTRPQSRHLDYVIRGLLPAPATAIKL